MIAGCSEQPFPDYELGITGAKTNRSFKWREKCFMFAAFSTPQFISWRAAPV